MHKKNHGSYYTPEFLSDFIMEYLAPHYKGQAKVSFLEPSCGDGNFLKSFSKTKFPKSIQSFSVQAVEKLKTELEKAKAAALTARKKNTRYSFTKNDFLKFQSGVNRQFSLIAGNPPYIKKSLLFKTQIQQCATIHKSAGLKDNSIKNIWTSFLIRCCQLLTEDGIIAFVLPAELLQVNFSLEIRKYLTSLFDRTEIFTFDDLLFDCKGQDTVLLIGFKKHELKGQFYTHITNTEQLANRKFILEENKALQATQTKWTHHQLSADDLTFIHKIAGSLSNIDSFCESKPGIVTAANSYFIIDQNIEQKYGLTEFAKPIIQKGLFVNGSVVFDEAEYQTLVDAGKPTKVLCFNDEGAKRLPQSVKNYLKIGVEKKLAEGYKCSKRTNWFVIPNITESPEGFFFRRIHHYPKLLKNDASVLVTDTAYQINMKGQNDINSLIYSFYNSLSLTLTELSGRYYGGGVLELTPSEFKSISIPYQKISETDFTSFRNSFEAKENIDEVLLVNDVKLLKNSLGLTLEEIEKVQSIRKQLLKKRFRK